MKSSSLILFIITSKFMFQYYLKMIVPFKNLKDDDNLNNEEIYSIISNFDPEKDNFSESIEHPKNGDIFIHFSKDDDKLDDWKADGIVWEKRGQKLIFRHVPPWPPTGPGFRHNL